MEQITEQLLEIAALILAGITAWALAKLRSYLKAGQNLAEEKLKEEHRAVIYPALQYAISYARSRAGIETAGSAALGADAKAKLVNDAVMYVRQAVPRQLDELGITDENLRRMLEARWQNAVDYLNIPAAK